MLRDVQSRNVVAVFVGSPASTAAGNRCGTLEVEVDYYGQDFFSMAVLTLLAVYEKEIRDSWSGMTTTTAHIPVTLASGVQLMV